MQVGKTIYLSNRRRWRAWLEKNHAKKKEIWLIYPRRTAASAVLTYNDAVEEALCFGWIDGIIKKIDDDLTAQRWTPRRSPRSQLSETNKERVRRLIAAGLMTPAGLEKIKVRMDEKFVPAKDILAALRADPVVWRNFQNFPA